MQFLEADALPVISLTASLQKPTELFPRIFVCWLLVKQGLASPGLNTTVTVSSSEEALCASVIFSTNTTSFSLSLTVDDAPLFV
jgi:hypothetical protein